MSRRKADVIPLHVPDRVLRSLNTVVEANRTCDERHLADTRDARTRCISAQVCVSASARYNASFVAWKRHAAWATEERLEADAQAFADTVAREYPTIAPVIALADSKSRRAR